MSRSNNEIEEITEEVMEKESDGSMSSNKASKDCIKLSGLNFELCVGHAYTFLVGRRSILGIVEEINPRYLKVIVMTERGKVIIDLRKTSMIEEVKM